MKKSARDWFGRFVSVSLILTAPPAFSQTHSPRYVEHALTLALPQRVLGAIDRLEVRLGSNSEITVEGTDAIPEGSFSLPLRVQADGSSELIQDWSRRFLALQNLSGRTLTIEFPDTRCVVASGRLRGICLGKTGLRLPKRLLIDLAVSGWTRARFREVRARKLELIAPAMGFLRMNATLANIVLTGGGPEFDSVISGVLAADPNNAFAGDFTANLADFRTLLLARIQGTVVVTRESKQPDLLMPYLRVDDQVVTEFPYERP